MRSSSPKIKSVEPAAGIEGGKVVIEGSGFDPELSAHTKIDFGGVAGRALLISSRKIVAQVPEEAAPGPISVSVKGKNSNPFEFKLGTRLSSNVNPVDNPVFDRDGNLYVTFSGKRGENAPVSVFKINPDGSETPHLTNIPNATSMAFDKQDNLFISSRFEGTVYKATPRADVTVFAKDLGAPTGLAFDAKGSLYVGDRGGRIFKVTQDGQASVFAEVPESMVAYHLAVDADGNLLVSSPGLSSYNNLLLIDQYGKLIPLYGGFGRPQGIAVDGSGNIYVCEAKVGDSSILKISPGGQISTLVTGPIMVGLAFDPRGNLAVCTPSAVYKVALGNHQSKRRGAGVSPA
jgi:sugar lactone lactonase YvrE